MSGWRHGWTWTAIAATLLPGAAGAQDTVAGQRTFAARCSVCHAIRVGAPSGMGPNLSGVVGRQAGTAPRFAYSAAMKAAGLKWDAATLDAYLASPTRKVPGSRMPIALTGETDRANVIAYLVGVK